jgi:hypothetical protein
MNGSVKTEHGFAILASCLLLIFALISQSWQALILVTENALVLAPARSQSAAVDMVISQSGGQPHFNRIGPNLAPDPAVTSMSAWTNGWMFDTTVSRTSGSGSIKFATSTATVSTYLIPITPGKTYTYSVYMKSEQWPTIMSMLVVLFDANKKYITDRFGSRQSNSVAGKWEETSMIYTAQPGDVYLKVKLARYSYPAAGAVWIDDLYFGEGVGFEQPPTPKNSFNGTMYKVDALGNFEKNNNGTYEPFLPFCICADGYRPDFSFYVKAGFNCITWAGSVSTIKQAKNAGMVAGLDVSDYAMYGNVNYKNTNKIQQMIQQVHDNGLDDALLMYYFDNETYQNVDPNNQMDMWNVSKSILETIDSTEKSINNGRRIRPRQMLTGNQGMARMYSGYIDVVSDYINSTSGYNDVTPSGNNDGTPAGLKILANIEGQSAPLFAQINPSAGANTPMRKKIYESLIGGAKGFSFWRDIAPADPNAAKYIQYGAIPIENTPWYTDLPVVRKEVEQLLPVFRQPNWVNWKVQPSDSSVLYGSRDYNGEAYIILVNDGMTSSPVHFNVSGLSYSPVSVEDALTGQTVADFSGGGFSYSFSGKETAVLHLVSVRSGNTSSTPPSSPADNGQNQNQNSNQQQVNPSTARQGSVSTNPATAVVTNNTQPAVTVIKNTTSSFGSTIAINSTQNQGVSNANTNSVNNVIGTSNTTNAAKPFNSKPIAFKKINNLDNSLLTIPTTTIDITVPKVPSWIEVLVALFKEIVNRIKMGAGRTVTEIGNLF